MNLKENFPIQINKLENKINQDKYFLENWDDFERSFLKEETMKQMESFLNIDEFSYEKLRIFFSNYWLNVVKNYFKYIDKNNNFSINNYIDAINAYSHYQIENWILEKKSLKKLLINNWVLFQNQNIFEQSLNESLKFFRENYVLWNSLQNKYRETLEYFAEKKYIPKNLNYSIYREIISINNTFTNDDIFALFENNIDIKTLRELSQVWINNIESIKEIQKLTNEMNIEEIISRLAKISDMFESDVPWELKIEIIKYPLSLELYEFLYDNPQELSIWNKKIEFSHKNWPINVFRGILKLAQKKCYTSLDEISALYLVKEYEKSLNDFIEEWKEDYWKVFSLIQTDKAFLVSQNVDKIFEKNYWENYTNIWEKYSSKQEFFSQLERYLNLNPNSKVLLYIAWHGWADGSTQTDIWTLYKQDLDRLKALSMKYNFDLDFDSCMSWEKIKWETGIIRWSSLYEDNFSSLVVKDLLKAFRWDVNLNYQNVRDLKNIIWKTMYQRLENKMFLWDIVNINYYFNLDDEEKNAASKVMNYINTNNPKNWDFSWDGKVTWNEATLFKFLEAKYNIIPITYAKKISWETTQRQAIELS